MCPSDLPSVGLRPGRFQFDAMRKAFEEMMDAELQKMGIPAKFLVVEPGESTSRAHAEMDAQLLNAILGVK